MSSSKWKKNLQKLDVINRSFSIQLIYSFMQKKTDFFMNIFQFMKQNQFITSNIMCCIVFVHTYLVSILFLSLSKKRKKKCFISYWLSIIPYFGVTIEMHMWPYGVRKKIQIICIFFLFIFIIYFSSIPVFVFLAWNFVECNKNVFFSSCNKNIGKKITKFIRNNGGDKCKLFHK